MSRSIKLGDLVRPVPCFSHFEKGVIVEEHWIGIVIDFSKASRLSKGTEKFPVVYWNDTFNSEVEDPSQIEVIS